MSAEPPKNPPSNPEHSYPPPMLTYPPQHFSGAYPQYYYAPPADGENAPGPQPYMMLPPPPPGMVYAYPPVPSPSQGSFSPGMPPIIPRPKRKQVKMACTNCAQACKRCDDMRPCERCQKYGVAASCVDGQRKERKKGIKRGPYKRKPKADEINFPLSPDHPPEWSAAAPASTPPMHAFAPPPEGYFPHPYYYPPPPGFVPPTHEGAEGQPPLMPYYMHPPYPGFPHYPPYGPAPTQQPVESVESAKKGSEEESTEPEAAVVAVKKRRRPVKGAEGKKKKAKNAAKTEKAVTKPDPPVTTVVVEGDDGEAEAEADGQESDDEPV